MYPLFITKASSFRRFRVSKMDTPWIPASISPSDHSQRVDRTWNGSVPVDLRRVEGVQPAPSWLEEPRERYSQIAARPRWMKPVAGDEKSGGQLKSCHQKQIAAGVRRVRRPTSKEEETRRATETEMLAASSSRRRAHLAMLDSTLAMLDSAPPFTRIAALVPLLPRFHVLSHHYTCQISWLDKAKDRPVCSHRGGVLNTMGFDFFTGQSGGTAEGKDEDDGDDEMPKLISQDEMDSVTCGRIRGHKHRDLPLPLLFAVRRSVFSCLLLGDAVAMCLQTMIGDEVPTQSQLAATDERGHRVLTPGGGCVA
ncbi:hypothetical protein B0H13DRAFT_1913880 [Mycena leptocephala]|nr:hypothetical protein B0H13DRAFT_1913880 [Mycena leptocephala]